ncbi:MAG TPA: trypsin-like peptidase domain-containing protein [Planctomycetota bacterium]|nr:trypsin-like peptidase domain-containing protein [Planctomycetota bacterium]
MKAMTRLTCTVAFAVSIASAAMAASRRTPVVEAVEKCSPAVVNISTERIITRQYDQFFGHRDRMFDDLFEQFRNRFRPREYRASSLGSGAIIDPSGIVVTNEHVISKATKIAVTMSDKTQYGATLISSDADNDLAVLKIDADRTFPFIEVGTSSDLMTGETVIALGNPFGFTGSVSVGVLSATDRTVSTEGQVVFENLIQTDAAINPGSSGGPLVNINGEMIGVNVAVMAEAQGIGFALPVDRVRNVLTNLLSAKMLKRLWVGLELQEITPDLAKELNLKQEGALVSGIEPGSPAAGSAMRRQDVVVEVDGIALRHPYDFQRILLQKEAGQKLSVKYLRGKTQHTASLAVERMPQKSGIELAKEKLGLELDKITPSLARKLDIQPGVGLLISGVVPNGPAFDAGIERGDIILSIGGRPVADDDKLAALLEQLRPKSAVHVVLYRNNVFYRGYIKLR